MEKKKKLKCRHQAAIYIPNTDATIKQFSGLSSKNITAGTRQSISTIKSKQRQEEVLVQVKIVQVGQSSSNGKGVSTTFFCPASWALVHLPPHEHLAVISISSYWLSNIHPSKSHQQKHWPLGTCSWLAGSACSLEPLPPLQISGF